MKTKLLFLVLCLVATSSVFAQSRQKIKRKKIVKTAVVTKKATENTDFEIISKFYGITSGIGMVSTQNPNQKMPADSKSYSIILKPSVPKLLIQGIMVEYATQDSKYKDTLSVGERLVFNFRSNVYPHFQDTILKEKVIFNYRKNGVQKSFIVTDFKISRANRG